MDKVYKFISVQTMCGCNIQYMQTLYFLHSHVFFFMGMQYLFNIIIYSMFFFYLISSITPKILSHYVCKTYS